jgi:WhiB family redox-sensing transcriptional regulator
MTAALASVVSFQTASPEPWAEHAACRGLTGISDLFTDASTRAEANQALAVCARCPVRPACLALGRRLRADGVWGGHLLQRGQIRR